MSVINQKEYLKKYLGIGKSGHKKKKKKKDKISINSGRIQIIDDDLSANSLNNLPEEDPFTANDDAPQIVAIIDERPRSMRIDDKTKDNLWQPIGGSSNNSPSSLEPKEKVGFKLTSLKVSSKQQESSKSKSVKNSHVETSKTRREGLIEIIDDEDDSQSSQSRLRDVSPVISKCDDYSPPRKQQSRSIDPSPPRRRRRSINERGNDNISPPRKNVTIDDDSSPLRKNQDISHIETSKTRRKGLIETINNEDDSQSSQFRVRDVSPVLRRSDDYSPPRKQRMTSIDPSPPRRRGSSINERGNDNTSPPRKNVTIDDDSSPVRKNQDISPTRNKRYYSPLRKSKSYSSSIVKIEDPSPSRTRKSDKDTPERKEKRSRWEQNDDNDDNNKVAEKMKKTLDGKSAGLQNAKDLVKETQKFKEREENIFKNMSKQVSGENATTVRRDRKTGKIRNLGEEEEHARKKREAEEKNKEKYSKWGRGLVQIENRDKRVQEELYEMSKPLARYADDKDLENYLKDQERDGDPMLAYIRSKKRKEKVKSGIPEKPQYQGEFMPNRFGIRPGHRWDGVDRSSGYEKKWFEVQNEKRSIQEDNYKWSTEDM